MDRNTIINLAVLAVFLAGMAYMGVYFSKSNRDTEAYFLGGRAMPGWAVGLSMLGTSISSVTFLAFPAAAFALDYRLLVPNFTAPLVALLAAWIFVPFFRRDGMVTAYEYLEKRFGIEPRLYAAFAFLLSSLVRLAVVLYLIALPLTGLLGLRLEIVIVAVGIVTLFYTVSGGLEAVVWTDVVQTFVLFAGGLLCIALAVWKVPGGLAGVIRTGMECDKFSLGPCELTFGERSLPLLVLMGITSFLSEYCSNQNIIQRYIAAGSLREARKATLISAFGSFPTWILFFFLGTCLFAFYRLNPGLLPPGTPADAVLPHFILHETPAGVGGIIIAACLAAAMSTLSSCLNGFSAVLTVDFVKRFRPGTEDGTLLRFARYATLAAGAVMIGGALWIDRIPKESMNDFNICVGALIGGGITAMYLAGFFLPRIGRGPLLAGIAAALLFNFYMAGKTLGWVPERFALGVHPYATTVLSNVILFAVAWSSSLFARRPEGIEALTVQFNRRTIDR